MAARRVLVMIVTAGSVVSVWHLGAGHVRRGRVWSASLVSVVRGWGGATLAINPAGVAVLVVLLLPDGHSMFDFVDDVSTCEERFRPVACADAYPNSHFAYGEVADAVYACGVFDAEAFDCFRDDAFALFDGERLECLVFQVANRQAFVVIADPTFER